jgi:glycolate oxidase iron-sulfur subunit
MVFPFPARMKLMLRVAKVLKFLGAGKWTPKFARETLRLIPEDSNAAGLPRFSPAATPQKRGQVGFISGCVMSAMFGRTNRASVRWLNRLGYDVITPPDQICCGALFAHSGDLKRARSFARRNIKVFERLNVDAIVINAAGCGSTLKEYGHLLEADSAWSAPAQSFSKKVRDLTEFLIPHLNRMSDLSSACSFPVTYHDACHLAHPQRIFREPRELIRAVAGSNYVELAEADVCCGSAGSYNLTEPAMAERLQHRKIQNVIATGAEIVVTTNPGCILQIQAGLAKAGAQGIRVMHLADFLDDLAKRTP